MTEKESAHPLSPAAEVEVGKTISEDGNEDENSAGETVSTPESPPAAAKQKSIVPVSPISCYFSKILKFVKNSSYILDFGYREGESESAIR